MTLWFYTIKGSLGGAWDPQNWAAVIRWPHHRLNPAVRPSYWLCHLHIIRALLCATQTVSCKLYKSASPLEMGRAPKCLVRWSHPSVQQRHKPNQGQRLSAYVNADLLSSNMLSLASTCVESLGSCLATRIFHVCQLNQRSKCAMQHLETLCEFIKFSGGLWVHKAVNWLQATEAIIFSSATKAATLPYCPWHVKRHSASTHSSQQAENRLARRRLWEAAGLCHLESQQRQFSTERKMHDKYKQLFWSGSACECVHS